MLFPFGSSPPFGGGTVCAVLIDGMFLLGFMMVRARRQLDVSRLDNQKRKKASRCDADNDSS